LEETQTLIMKTVKITFTTIAEIEVDDESCDIEDAVQDVEDAVGIAMNKPVSLVLGLWS
jgi:hypothetical protein